MDVSVVIVNWNSHDILKECLASLMAHTSDLQLEIVVIDSGSFDGCDRMLRDHYPWIRFIQSRDNLGFARANNRAARDAQGEYLLFLNPDTKLVGPAVNELRAAFASHSQAGVIGPRLMNPDGSIQSSCIQSFPTILNQLLDSEVLRRLWPRSRLWGMAPLYEVSAEPREVEGVSGACLMVERRTFDQVGGFSEDYFMYGEDMDLACKLKDAGYRNYFVPAATVVHYGGGSSEQAPSAFTAVMLPEAIWRFLRKTRGELYGCGYRAGMCASALGRLMVLSLVRPLASRSGRGAHIEGAVRKWRAVLRWSLKRDDIVSKYYSRQEPSYGA